MSPIFGRLKICIFVNAQSTILIEDGGILYIMVYSFQIAELFFMPVSVSNFKLPHKYFALTFESHLEKFSSNVYKPAKKNCIPNILKRKQSL